jgi:hypothetical protein
VLCGRRERDHTAEDRPQEKERVALATTSARRQQFNSGVTSCAGKGKRRNKSPTDAIALRTKIVNDWIMRDDHSV